MKIGGVDSFKLNELDYNISEFDKLCLKVRTILTVKSGCYTIDRTENTDNDKKMCYVTFTYTFQNDDLKIIYTRRGEESLYHRVYGDSLLDYTNVSLVISDSKEMYFNSVKGDLKVKFDNLFNKCYKVIRIADRIYETNNLKEKNVLPYIKEALKSDNDDCEYFLKAILDLESKKNVKSRLIDNRFIVTSYADKNSGVVIYEVRDLELYDPSYDSFDLNNNIMCQYIVDKNDTVVLSYEPGLWDYYFIDAVKKIKENNKSKRKSKSK